MSDAAGSIVRIWLKPDHGKPMLPVESARIELKGIAGDAQLGSRRTVTLLSAERWARVDRELKTTVDPALRRANLLLSGVDLAVSAGRVLRVGPVRLEIRGETAPCDYMDEQHPGLQAALGLDWGGGAFARVLTPGDVRVGDPVSWD